MRAPTAGIFLSLFLWCPPNGSAEGPACPEGTVEIARDETTRDLHCARITGLGLEKIRRLNSVALGALSRADAQALRQRQETLELARRVSLEAAYSPSGGPPLSNSPRSTDILAVLAAAVLSWAILREFIGNRIMREAKREMVAALIAGAVLATATTVWLLLGAGRPGARVLASAESRAPGLTSSLRRPGPVSSPKLQNIINAMFKPGDQFRGGTAGAIRNEILTGQKTAGKWHFKKGEDLMKGLDSILRQPELNSADRATAEALRQDLAAALRDRPAGPP